MKTYNIAADCPDRRVARVIRVVAHDLSQRTTLVEAARVAGLNPAYFSRRFRQIVGMNFVQWSRYARIEEAKRLLRIVDLSITGISASVGYPDLTTFERAFKSCVGVSPRVYRRQSPPSFLQTTASGANAAGDALVDPDK